MANETSLIMSFAEWIWGSDPSTDVSPAICLESFPFLTGPCFSRLVARLIGIAIISLAFVNKAPVVVNIFKSNTVTGLSVAASYSEVILYSNAAFYNILRGNPFTAFGETLVLLFQTIIVVVLIWWLKDDPKITGPQRGVAFGGYMLYLFVVFRVLTPDSHFLLMGYNLPVLIYSRGSQIVANYRQKQTGAQSIVTTGLNLSGSAVRIFTTIKEVGWDFNILRAYGTSVSLNIVLFVQIWIYRSNTEKFLKELNKLKEK